MLKEMQRKIKETGAELEAWGATVREFGKNDCAETAAKLSREIAA